MKDIFEVLRYKNTKLLLSFVVFTFLSIFYALISHRAYDFFQDHIGFIILFISGYFILDTYHKINKFLFFLVVFHTILIFLNLEKFTLSSTVRVGSFEAGYFLGDGNDFAWSLNITFPFSIYLFFIYRNKFIPKLFFLFSTTLIFFGIIGTSSRGATIAVIASSTYFIFTNKNKMVSGILIGVIAFSVLVAAPAAYITRMESIKDYETDSSAKMRIIAWKAAFKMAVDHPLGVGAGNFPSVYGRFYRTDDPAVWASGRWIGAHSIYFATLGELGFIGLFLHLFLKYSNYQTNNNSRNLILTEKQSYTNEARYYQLTNMSIIGYAASGLFLGGVNYPHLYVLTFLTIRGAELTQKAMR